MKLNLIAALFIATLVVVPCLAAEEDKQEAAKKTVADVPEITENKNVDEPSELTDNEDAKDEEKAENTADADEQIPEEFRDEIEQEKRRRSYLPQLSHRSCLILRKYRYCRHVEKFCRRICRRCRNLLSRSSCHKVGSRYRACGRRIGRVYCRKTCGHCGRKLPKQCMPNRYHFLNESNRNVNFKNNPLVCDNKLNGWYRLVGKAGLYIPNTCVHQNHCGTHAPGWIVGKYPKISGETVIRKVCYNWGKYRIKYGGKYINKDKCCNWHNLIKVTNCGGFYVFHLRPTPVCSLRYCGSFIKPK